MRLDLKKKHRRGKVNKANILFSLIVNNDLFKRKQELVPSKLIESTCKIYYIGYMLSHVTPLYMATVNVLPDAEIVTMLLSAGANTNI
jgi:hypothetical protein